MSNKLILENYIEILKDRAWKEKYDPFIFYKQQVKDLMNKEHLSYQEAKEIIEKKEMIKFSD